MTKFNKNLTVKFLVGVFLAYVLSVNLFPCMCCNGSGDGYDSSSDSGANASLKGNIIETYVIEGAGSFLNAQAKIMMLLNKVEMSDLKGIDYNELQAIVSSALEYMKDARLSYDNLIKTAEKTPYKENVTAKLVSFGYDEFSVENNLNPTIFQKVKNYLSVGDITGTYRKIYDKFGKIINLLNLIKNEISANKTPELPNLWKLNQVSSQTLLFGQYIAIVFSEILPKTKDTQ